MADEYDAFISYSHGADGCLAVALRDGLQQFAKPWNHRRAMRVFLDRSSLELTSGLGDSLEEKLSSARYLVLLASAESAASRWCDLEARFWVESKEPDSLLLVLTDDTVSIEWDGAARRFDPERSTALPPGLIDAYPEEPQWLDMRWVDRNGGRTPFDLRNPQFRDAVATLASAIRSLPKDELDGEDVRQHRRFSRIRRAAIGGLVALTVAAVALGAWALLEQSDANEQRREAETQASIAAANEREAETQASIAGQNAAESASRELAARSALAVDNDPILAVLLAVEAHYPTEDTLEGATADAERSLLQAVAAYHAADVRRVGRRIDVQAETLDVHPDGRQVVTAAQGADGTVELVVWSRESGEVIARPSRQLRRGSARLSVQYADDGSKILVTGVDPVVVWAPETDEVVELVGATDSATLLPGGDVVAALVADTEPFRDRLARYDLGSSSVPEFEVIGEVEFEQTQYWTVRALADGRVLLAGNGLFLSEGLDSLERIQFDVPIRDIVVGPDGEVFVDTSRVVDVDTDPDLILENTIGSLTNAGTWVEHGPLQSPQPTRWGASAWSPDGSRVVSVDGMTDGRLPPWVVGHGPGRGARVYVWDVEQLTQQLVFEVNEATDAAWVDDTTLAVSSRRGVEYFALVESLGRQLELTASAVGAAADLSTLVTWSADDPASFAVWDGTGRRLDRFDAPVVGSTEGAGPVPHLFATDGERIAVAVGDDGMLGIDGLPLDPPSPALAFPLAFAPDGTHVVGLDDGAIVVLETDTWTESWRVAGDGSAQRLDASRMGDTVVVSTVDTDGSPKLRIARRTGARVVETRGMPSRAETIALSPDGDIIATGHLDGSVHWWRADDGSLLRSVDDHVQPVTSLAFADEGDALVSVAGNVVVRRVADGVELFSSTTLQSMDDSSYDLVVADTTSLSFVLASTYNSPFILITDDPAAACRMVAADPVSYAVAIEQLRTLVDPAGDVPACDRVAGLSPG